MRVPSRSKKTARITKARLRRVGSPGGLPYKGTTGARNAWDSLEARFQFSGGNGSSAQLADGDAAGAVGEISGLARIGAAEQSEREDGDRGIACAGDVENFFSTGG